MLKFLRKMRKRMWKSQIILGDLIALLNGRFIRRWVLKKTLRRSGKLLKRLTG